MQSERPQFIVPAGVQLEAGPDGLSLRFAGDVVLDAALGLKLRRVESTGGDVTLSAALGSSEIGEISALQGKVHAKADLRAGRVLASEVHVRGAFSGEAVSARSLRLDGPVRCERLLASAGPLVLGASADISGEVVAEAGDILAAGPLRSPSVRASGRVTLRGAAELGLLQAGGEVLAQAELRADAIEAGQSVECLDKLEARVVRAETVRLMGPRTELKMVQARSSISVGPGRVTADVFIAPVVDLAPRASGRVTVIESHNELGPCAVSGKLRLSELASLIGDVDAFLAERGLSRLAEGEWSPPAAPRGAPVELSEAHFPELPVPSAAPVAAPSPAPAPPEPWAPPVAPPAPAAVAGSAAGGSEESLEDILAAYPSAAAALQPEPPAAAGADPEPVDDIGWWDEESTGEAELAPLAQDAPSHADASLGGPGEDPHGEDTSSEDHASGDDLNLDDLNLDDLNFDALSPAAAVAPEAQPEPAAVADNGSSDVVFDEDAQDLDASLLMGDEGWDAGEAEPEGAPVVAASSAPVLGEPDDGLVADTLVGPLAGMGGLLAAAMGVGALPIDPDEGSGGVGGSEPFGGEALTGELQLPDLGDISEMDEETLLRKLIESPIPGLPQPQPRVAAPPPAPLPEDPQLQADFAAVAFSFDPSDEGADAGSDEATEAPVTAAAPAARPEAPAPLPPGGGLTDAPSLAFVSRAALLGGEPRDEERLFEVSAEDLQRANELSTDEVAMQLGRGPADALPVEPPTAPAAIVEDVPVRRPLGPQPSGSGQLMLIEELSAPMPVQPVVPVEVEAESAPVAPLPPLRPSLSPVSAPMLPQPPAAPAAPVVAPAPSAPALALPRPAPAQDGPPNPVLALMLETMSRIRKAYGDSPPPPPLDAIDSLLASRDYARIREEFQGEVTALIDHHRKSGATLSPRVSHQLRIIDTLVHNL